MDEYEKLDAMYSEAIESLAKYVRTVVELDETDQEEMIATICQDIEALI